MKSKPQILLVGHSWVRSFAEFKDIAAENGFIFESNWWHNANLETVIHNIERFKLIKHYHRNLLVFCMIPETWRYETLENIEPIYDNAGVPINPYEILMPNPNFEVSIFIEKFTKFREQCLTNFPKLNIVLVTPPRIDVYQYNLKITNNFPSVYQEIFLTNPKYSLSQMSEYSRNVYAKILEMYDYNHGWPEKSIFRNQISAQKVKWCRKTFTKYMKQEIDTCGENGPLVNGLNPSKDLIEMFWKQMNGWLKLDQELCDNPLATYFLSVRNPDSPKMPNPKVDRFSKLDQSSSSNLISTSDNKDLNIKSVQVLLLGDSWVKYVEEEQILATEFGFQLDSQWWKDANFDVIMQNIDKYLKPFHKFLIVSCITSEGWKYEMLEDFAGNVASFPLQEDDDNYVCAGFQPNAYKVLMPNLNFSISGFVKKFNKLRNYCSQISSETHVMLLLPTIIDAYHFNMELISNYPESQQEIFHNNPKYAASAMAEYSRKLFDKLSLMSRRWPASSVLRNQVFAERTELTKVNIIRFRKGKLDTCGKESPLLDGINPTVEVIKLFWEQMKLSYGSYTGMNVVREPLPDGQASKVLMIGDDSVKYLNFGTQSSISQLTINFLSFGNVEQLIKLANTYLNLDVDVLFLTPFNWEFLYLANYVPYEEEPKVPLINESVEIDKLIEIVKNSTEIWKQSFPDCKVIWALPHPIDFQKHYEWKVTEFGMNWNATPEMNYEILYMTKAFYSLILQLEKEWKQSIPEIHYIDLRQCFFAEEPNLEYTFCDNNQPVFPSNGLSINGIDPSETLAQWFKMALVDKIEEMDKAVHLELVREKRRKQRRIQNYNRYLKKKNEKQSNVSQEETVNQNDAGSSNFAGPSSAAGSSIVVGSSKTAGLSNSVLAQNSVENHHEIGMEASFSNLKSDAAANSNLTDSVDLTKLKKTEKKKRKKMRQKEKLRLAAENPSATDDSTEAKAQSKPLVYLVYADGESHLMEEDPNLPKLMDLPLAPPGYMTSLSGEQDLLVTSSMLDTLGETLPYLKAKPMEIVKDDQELLKKELSMYTKLVEEEFSEVSPFRILDINQSSYSYKFGLFFQRSKWEDIFLIGSKEVAMDAILSAIKSILMLKCEKGVKVVMITTSMSFISEVENYLKPLVDKNFIGVNDDIPLGCPVALINTPSNLALRFSQPKLWDLSDVSAVIIYGDDLIYNLSSPATNELNSLIKLIYSNVHYERVNRVVISETGAKEYELVASQLLKTRFTSKIEMKCPPPKDESLSLFELLAAEIEKEKREKAKEELRKQMPKKIKFSKKKKFSNLAENKLSQVSEQAEDSTYHSSQNMDNAEVCYPIVTSTDNLHADANAHNYVADYLEIYPFDSKSDYTNLRNAEAAEFDLFLKNLGPSVENEYVQARQRIVISHEKMYQNFIEAPHYHMHYLTERSKFIEYYKLKVGCYYNATEMENALSDYWKKYVTNDKVTELKNKIYKFQDEYKSKYSNSNTHFINSTPAGAVHPVANDSYVKVNKHINSIGTYNPETNLTSKNKFENINDERLVSSHGVNTNRHKSYNQNEKVGNDNAIGIDARKLTTLKNNVNKTFSRIFSTQSAKEQLTAKNSQEIISELNANQKVGIEHNDSCSSQVITTKAQKFSLDNLSDKTLIPIKNMGRHSGLDESIPSFGNIPKDKSEVVSINKEITVAKPSNMITLKNLKGNPGVGKIKFSLSGKVDTSQPLDIRKNAYKLPMNKSKTAPYVSEKNISQDKYQEIASETSERKDETLYSEGEIKSLLLKEYPKQQKGPISVASSEAPSKSSQRLLVPVSDLLKPSNKKPSFGELLKMLGTSDRIEELMDVVSGQNLTVTNDSAMTSSVLSRVSNGKHPHSLDQKEKLELESNPGMQEYLRESRIKGRNKNMQESRPNDSSKKLKRDHYYAESSSQSSMKDSLGYQSQSEKKTFKLNVKRNQTFQTGPVAQPFQKEKDLDLLETSLSLLEPICDVLGMIGPSLRLVISQAKSCLPNYRQAFKIFAEEESISLVNFAINKMKSLSVGSDSSKYIHEIQLGSNLLLQANRYNSQPAPSIIVSVSEPFKPPAVFPVDVNLIAKATSGKDTVHIYEFIKNTYVYKCLYEPSANEIEEVFKAVSQIHFTMAFEK